jgi:predicted ribosomally synthesized peptide with nif11-like leader
MAHTPLGAMSEDQLKAFLEAAKADAGLQEKLKAAGDADAVVAIAKAAGFVISTDSPWSELTDEELEGVAGGGVTGNRYNIVCGWPSCLISLF